MIDAVNIRIILRVFCGEYNDFSPQSFKMVTFSKKRS